MAAILIVDDDASVLRIVQAALEFEGHEVITCEDGATALEILAADPLPDVLVLDWMLPDLDGLEVASRVRGDERTRGLAILMLTGHRDAEDEALAAGADVYMTKPFDPRMLEANVDLLVSFPRTGSGAPAAQR